MLVELLDSSNAIIAVQATGGGLYLFPDLLAGSYRCAVAASNFDTVRPLHGFVFTSGAYGPNPYPVTLSAGQHFLFADFGYARAQVSLTKRASTPQVLSGGSVTYTYVVVNPGDTWLDNVVVTDDRLGQICALADLARSAPGPTGAIQTHDHLAGQHLQHRRRHRRGPRAAPAAPVGDRAGDLGSGVRGGGGGAAPGLRRRPGSGAGVGPGNYQTAWPITAPAMSSSPASTWAGKRPTRMTVGPRPRTPSAMTSPALMMKMALPCCRSSPPLPAA